MFFRFYGFVRKKVHTYDFKKGELRLKAFICFHAKIYTGSNFQSAKVENTKKRAV